MHFAEILGGRIHRVTLSQILVCDFCFSDVIKKTEALLYLGILRIIAFNS